MTDLLSDLTPEQREGYNAFMRGERPTVNPYPWATANTECKQWIAGYSAARTDKARAIRRAQ